MQGTKQREGFALRRSTETLWPNGHFAYDHGLSPRPDRLEGAPAVWPAPRRLWRARWSSPFGPDNAFLRTVAPVVTPLALVELPSAGSCTGSPHSASGKRRGRGRPQARRIASSAPRRSAAPRPVLWRLIRKSRYPLHRAHGFAVGAGPGGGAPHCWPAWLWLWARGPSRRVPGGHGARVAPAHGGR